MAGDHGVLNIAAQEVAEGLVGARTIAAGYAEADNGPRGEDAWIRFLLGELRAGRMTLPKLDAWEAEWLRRDARADRYALKGAAETAEVLSGALAHLERGGRPALALVA